MPDIIRRLVVKGETTGLDTVKTEVQSVAAGLAQVAGASTGAGTGLDKVARSGLSVAGNLHRLRMSLDETYRMSLKLTQETAHLKAALDQKMISDVEHARMLDLVKNKYDAATIAARKNAEATLVAANAQRQFQSMTLAGAPAARGVITGGSGLRGGGAVPDATVVAKAGQALPKITQDMTSLGQSTKLTAFEVTNLGMQFNDIAVMATSGQNPMVLIMQQGMQLAQIMAMSSVATAGLKGTLAALGGAVVTFLTNPFYLAVAAAAALAGAITYLWSSFESGAPDAEESLKRHEALLDRVAEAYGKATVEAVRLHEAAGGGLLPFQAQTNVLEAQGQVAAALETTVGAIAKHWGDLNLNMLAVQFRELRALLEMGGMDPDTEKRMQETLKEVAVFAELAVMVEEFNKDAEDGAVLTEQWTEKFVALGENAPADVRATIVTVLDLVEVLDQANKRLLEATRLREHLQRLRAGEYIDPFAPTGRQAEQAGMRAYNEQLGIDPDKGIADRIDEETRAKEDYATATQTALDAAARESETVAELVDQLRFEHAIMTLNAEEQAVANAIRRAGALATAEQREEIDKLTRSLFRQAEAEKAAEEAAREAQRAADQAARDAKQAADAAAREAKRKQDLIDQLRFEHDIMDQSEEDQKVAIKLRELGADATAAQKTEVEALTRSMEQYKAAVKAAEEADKAALKVWEDQVDAAVEKMDEFRDSAKGILSAFIEGGPQAALEAVASRLTGLGEDLIIEGLFGKSGATGGGLFGDVIQDLLGGVPEKPVATMNVVAGVVNVGGPGAFVTGAAPAGGVVPGGMGALPGGMGTGGPGWPADVDLNAAAVAIRTIESGSAAGNYGALGPVTASGDRAYGAYQVMGANVGPWTAQHYGQTLTSQQFLANQAAQDAVFRGQFGSYINQYGLSGAPQAWFGGPGSVGQMGRTDILGTSVGGYSGEFNRLYEEAMKAAPAVDELTGSIGSLKAPIDSVVNSILNFAPGGTAISSQAASAITSGFGGFFQHGGALGAGQWGIAGEHGPELIHGPANVTPMQRGPSSKFNVNIKTQEGVSARVTRAEQNEEGDFDLEIFAEALERRVRDRYGLRQQVSRWGRA